MRENCFLLNVEQGQDVSMRDENVGTHEYVGGEDFAMRLDSLIIDVLKFVLVNDFSLL